MELEMAIKIIEIFDTETQKTHIYEDKYFSFFSWEEGNDSCDWNRGIHAGVYTLESSEGKCGESRFTIKILGNKWKTYSETKSNRKN